MVERDNHMFQMIQNNGSETGIVLCGALHALRLFQRCMTARYNVINIYVPENPKDLNGRGDSAYETLFKALVLDSLFITRGLVYKDSDEMDNFIFR